MNRLGVDRHSAWAHDRHQSAREVHEQHESNRSAEAARVRQEVRAREAAVRVEGLWCRRVWALQNTSARPSDDWAGAVE